MRPTGRRKPDRGGARPGPGAGDGPPRGSGAAGVRLNKLLASRGLGARRKCDALIQAGSVRVNGRVVREPGLRVLPERDRVEVHGRLIPGPGAPRYLILHKPVGVITTLHDPEGRPTVGSLLPRGPRLFPVGRLDAETSGLLLATNDGGLAHHLMHPRYGVRKLYRVRLDRAPDAEQVQRLRTGVEFEPGVISGPCEVRVRSARADRPEMDVALREGRYRQVRRMCEAVGLSVRGLHRAAYGPLRLGTLPRGAWRELTAEEVRRLRAASARPAPPPAPGGARSPARAMRAGAPGSWRRTGGPHRLRGWERPSPGAESPTPAMRGPTARGTRGAGGRGPEAGTWPRRGGSAERRGGSAERRGGSAERRGGSAERRGGSAERRGGSRSSRAQGRGQTLRGRAHARRKRWGTSGRGKGIAPSRENRAAAGPFRPREGGRQRKPRPGSRAPSRRRARQRMRPPSTTD